MREPRAYSIEDQVFGGKFNRLRERPEGMTVADQQAIVDLLYNYFDLKPVPTVVRRRGALSIDSWADDTDNRLIMGSLAGPAMVCHEVAHLLTPGDDRPHHSQAWERAYVLCVRIAISDYHSRRLEKAFKTARKPASKRAARR